MSTTTETTERDVIAHYFADEWLVVAQNTQDQAEQLYSDAREALKSETPVAVLGDQLREDWERLAEQVKDLTTEHISEDAGLFIGQMLQGWGTYPFDIIARRAIEQVKETESLLKTGEK